MNASVYLHVPFCRKKCVYCDFFSITDLSQIDAYVNGLLKEISFRSDARLKIETVYFGGGTPSVLPVRFIERILSRLSKQFDISGDAEITMEINPGTVDSLFFKDLKSCGVNRLSIGIQSFSDAKLQFLGRIHTAFEARQAILDSRSEGFDNIGIDLIYGVPGESLEQWQTDMTAALEYDLSHLSCYMLTVEEDTPLYHQVISKKILPQSSETLSDFFIGTSQFLCKNGWDHYEISNFAKCPEKRSRHNQRYWQRDPYLGFGPSAHSFDGKTRTWNPDDLGRYLEGIAQPGTDPHLFETLTKNQAMLEVIMLGLRTSLGIDINAFDRQFEISFARRFENLIRDIESEELGQMDSGRFYLNIDGQSCLNSILERFSDQIFS